jgi:hypothetical protein
MQNNRLLFTLNGTLNSQEHIRSNLTRSIRIVDFHNRFEGVVILINIYEITNFQDNITSLSENEI